MLLGARQTSAAHIRVTRHTIPVPNLPPAFAGKTVAVLADLHHGPFVGIDFIRDAVRLTNALAPDLITLVGNYLSANFTASSNGHGGTIVVDPAAASATVAHRFIAAAAGLGASAGGSVHVREASPVLVPMLAGPRFAMA